MSEPERPSITCPRCARISHHPIDVETGYCGNCRDFTAFCAHCGRSASLCHPNDPDRPDCYRLVTAYNEPLGEQMRREMRDKQSRNTDLFRDTVNRDQALRALHGADRDKKPRRVADMLRPTREAIRRWTGGNPRSQA